MSHAPRASSSRRIQFVPGGPDAQSETQGTASQPNNSDERERDAHSTATNADSGNHPPSQSLGENVISAGVIQSLEDTVESFRRGDLSKVRAISKLASILSIGDDPTNDSAKESALTQCLASIDSFSQSHSQSDQYGRIIDAGLHPGQRQSSADREEIEQIISDIAASSKRGNSIDEGADEESERHHSGRGLSNKKRRLYEDDMPWFKRESLARQSADPSCQATREILGTFGSDFAYVKRSIQLAQSSPAGFPASEWDNIIRGIAVNIDNVYSSLHHVAPVKENVGRVGSTEISLGHTEPSRRVRTNGDWISAYNEIVKATSFVFPHREQELRDYGEYINREFSSKVVASHRRIILYDAAVRNEVGGGQQMLLTDRHKFSFIYSAIVMPDGIESEFGKQKSSIPDGNRPQLNFCRRFNSASGCPDGPNCRYKHTCRKCKRPRP